MNLEAFVADIDRMLGWIPTGCVGLALIAGAVMIALSLYRLAVWLLKRAFGTRLPLIGVFIDRTAGPARLAVCLAAIALVLPLAPLDDAIRTPLMRMFVVAFIALIGWISIRLVDMSAARYLQNFRDVTENFIARKHVTQVRVFKRVIDTIVVIITVSTALMTFDSVRQYGVSLFASAGAAGLVVGLAARPLLSNLIAGVQIAITQPIRLDDVVSIEGDWGRIEEITGTYVVVRIWDERRLVVPLNWFIENPFQNWTRTSAQLIGTGYVWLDYRVPLEPLRDEVKRLCKAAPQWDGRVCVLQVTDANEHAIQLRILASSADSSSNWDLRCFVREGIITFVQQRYPQSLPRLRARVGELDEEGG